jgi:hypothetical protein
MITVWMINGVKIDAVQRTAKDFLRDLYELGERGLTFIEVTDGRGFVHHLRVREVSNVMELKS